MTFIGCGRNHHNARYFVWIVDCIHERERGAPGMTDEDWSLDAELRERVMQ